jgi:hypothetical protein
MEMPTTEKVMAAFAARKLSMRTNSLTVHRMGEIGVFGTRRTS